MNVHNKYKLEFVTQNGSCGNNSYGKFSILSNFLMYWDNPSSIIENLIPAINFGLKYGTKERYCRYQDVDGLEQKMKSRWIESNKEGISDFVKIDESWDRIKEYTGYYISELDFWLEGIGGDVTGIAFVTQENTTIEGSDLGDPPMQLPSIDFKEIVIEWLSFILRNKEILPKP